MPITHRGNITQAPRWVKGNKFFFVLVMLTLLPITLNREVGPNYITFHYLRHKINSLLEIFIDNVKNNRSLTVTDGFSVKLRLI